MTKPKTETSPKQKTKKPTKPKVWKPKHYSKAGLKARGWTDKSIALFLKEPDKEVTNPHYKCADPMKLYLITRVHRAEKTKGYQKFFQDNLARKEASKKAVETKITKLIEYAETCTVYVHDRPYDKLLTDTIRDYNEFHEEQAMERRSYNFDRASKDKPPEFLERLVVNHLRHLFSPYERELGKVHGKVGIEDAYRILNRRIYDEIARVYPHLKDECHKQFTRKFGETVH